MYNVTVTSLFYVVAITQNYIKYNAYFNCWLGTITSDDQDGYDKEALWFLHIFHWLLNWTHAVYYCSPKQCLECFCGV